MQYKSGEGTCRSRKSKQWNTGSGQVLESRCKESDKIADGCQKGKVLHFAEERKQKEDRKEKSMM
jgi:hypothetical protein